MLVIKFANIFFRTASVLQEEFESLFDYLFLNVQCEPPLVVAHSRFHTSKVLLGQTFNDWDYLDHPKCGMICLFIFFVALECSHLFLLLQSAGSALHYLQPAAALDPILLQPPHRDHRHHYCHHRQCRRHHHRHHRLHLVNDQ